MNTAELRDLIARKLEPNREIRTLVVLGNRVHVYTEDDEEFEIVIRVTQKPKQRWKDTLDGL